MAEVTISKDMQGFDGDTEKLETAIVKMQKNLAWLLEHLDSKNVRTLNTNLTEIQSEDGATRLDGARMVMEDGDGTVRAVIGKDTGGDFQFCLYDKNGKETIHLNDDGNAVFSGDIRGADIEGVNIRIAPNVFRDYIALENDGVSDSLNVYYSGSCIGGIRMLDAGGLLLFGDKIVLGSPSGTVSINSGASGTFESVDGKIVTVQKGVITSISEKN